MTGLPEDFLSAYLDGECTTEEAGAVEAMLAAEPAWRAMLADVRTARDAVRSLPVREPPPGFAGMVLAPAPARARARARARRPARAGAALVAAAAVVAGVALAIPRDRGERVTPPVASFAETHGATSSLDGDPVSTLAPVAVPARSEP